jgi:hypothetical protein
VAKIILVSLLFGGGGEEERGEGREKGIHVEREMKERKKKGKEK